MADKFREKFEVIRGDVLRANYGQNAWQERDQVVTSVSWVSLVEDARESLLRSRWDLVALIDCSKHPLGAERLKVMWEWSSCRHRTNPLPNLWTACRPWCFLLQLTS
jgi:hypothetical protein